MVVVAVLVVVVGGVVGVVVVVSGHPVPFSSSSTVVSIPKTHRSVMLLQPHSSMQSRAQVMDSQTWVVGVVGMAVVVSGHPVPSPSSSAVVELPSRQRSLTELQPHSSTQSRAHVTASQ